MKPKNLLTGGVLSLMASLSATSSAVIIRDDKPDKGYTDLAADAKYASVGKFNYVTDSSTGYGTAEYIGVGTGGKKWLLTASHNVDFTMNTASFDLAGKNYKVDIPSIRYLTGGDGGKWDIGVGQILDPDGTLTTSPAAFYNASIPVVDDLNKRVIGTCVGYGQTGNGKTGQTGNGGTKRAFQNTIDALGLNYNAGRDQLYGYISDFDDGTAASNTLDKTDFPAAKFDDGQKSDRTSLDLEGNGASGDSGGGLFADVGGANLLIGVTSVVNRLGSGSNTKYGAYTQWTPMDKEMSDQVTTWTGIKAVPEPSSWLALCAGAAFLLGRRLRRTATHAG